MKKLLILLVCGIVSAAMAEYNVGVYCDQGPEGIGAYEWFNLINGSPQMKLHLVDGADVRAGALEGLDLLVMPGGSSKKEYQSLKDEGMEKVRAFIRNGGGYLGTCAGCFLAVDRDSDPVNGKRMHVVPYTYKDCPQGTIFVKHKLTDEGKRALGMTNENWSVRFHGGTVMFPSTNAIEGAKFETWAKYVSDADRNKPVTEKNRMSGYDAIVGGTYGKGRVVVFGSHPEYYVSTVRLVDEAIQWILQDESVRTVRRYRKPGAKTVAFFTSVLGSKDAAEAAIRLNACDDYDVVPVDNEIAGYNFLEHVDMVVFPAGREEFTRRDASAIFKAYRAAGGKSLLHRPGADIVEEVRSAFAAFEAK